MYQKQEEEYEATTDVNLVSKDMELNFSNKNDDEDELEVKNNTTIDRDQDDSQDDGNKPERGLS